MWVNCYNAMLLHMREWISGNELYDEIYDEECTRIEKLGLLHEEDPIHMEIKECKSKWKQRRTTYIGESENSYEENKACDKDPKDMKNMDMRTAWEKGICMK